MKKRTNVTSKNPIIIDLINLFSRLKLRVGFFRFVVGSYEKGLRY